MRAVAERAGVSLGTVSNVLNGLPSVSPRNIERVQRAMRELGFVPNAHARSLRAARTDTIGLLVLSIANPFFAEVAHETQSIAEAHGSTMVIASSDQDLTREDRYLRMFEESRVRALIVAPVRGASEHLREVRRRGTPIVLLDEREDANEFCVVSLDGSAGGRIAAEHLLSIGRRRIAFVGGPLVQVADRVGGLSAEVASEPSAVLSIIDTSDLTVEEGARAARKIIAMAERDRPDGVFAGNDLVALGMLAEFEKLGVRVPDDIALVGFDDIDWARSGPIALTTITQPRHQIAQETIRIILDEESVDPNEHVHSHVRLAPELVVRSSSVRIPG